MPHCPTCYTQGTNNHSLKHPLQHSLGGGFPKAVLCMGTMWGPSVSWEAREEEGVPAKVFFFCVLQGAQFCSALVPKTSRLYRLFAPRLFAKQWEQKPLLRNPQASGMIFDGVMVTFWGLPPAPWLTLWHFYFCTLRSGFLPAAGSMAQVSANNLGLCVCNSNYSSPCAAPCNCQHWFSKLAAQR